MSRKSLEGERLWQVADELRFFEAAIAAEGPTHCDGRVPVVRFSRILNLVRGYSLNYFHWATEQLPALIRVRELVVEDPDARVLMVRRHISY